MKWQDGLLSIAGSSLVTGVLMEYVLIHASKDKIGVTCLNYPWTTAALCCSMTLMKTN